MQRIEDHIVVEHDTFGHFEFECLRWQTMPVEHRDHFIHDAPDAELQTEQIHADPEGRRTVAAPERGLRASFVKHPRTHGRRERPAFQRRKKRRRGQQSALWMPPADERFRAGQRPIGKVHLRLIEQHELTVVDGTVQLDVVHTALDRFHAQ